ncbi:MAG: amidophosphoribosyltransferase [Kiritimatiellae bacterium]|nr:amidophosphoribosyltransferase [Kiritimatiellia bacterium]
MSDAVKHECAVAMVRLLKPEVASTVGLARLVLLLEKQHNRGQDGAGMAVFRSEPVPGEPAYRVVKSAAANPLADLLARSARICDGFDARGFLGHLRYATFGKGDERFCHPFVHASPRLRRTLFLAGNFNLTNTRDLFDAYVRLGKHPDSDSDGYLITEWLASEMLHAEMRGIDGRDDVLAAALQAVLARMDGAYTLCGMTGDGWCFAVRDPHGIRPGFYCIRADAVSVASERPAIQAAFDCGTDEVCELEPGVAMLVSPEGRITFRRICPPAVKRSCVFERIYFSRANDAGIHRERKALGAALAKPILEAVDYDLEHTFFSYIPNSAQVAFHGLLEALWTEGLAEGHPVRFGQIAVKDAKFRTFIADAAAREEFYKHVYDVTYGLLRPGEDTLVVLDDSIVRGNTMKNAILPMLDRLRPKKIIVASSAPPICYPDCYGIDMSSLGELVAFRALMRLRNDDAPKTPAALRAAYAAFPLKVLSEAIARLLTPDGMRADVAVIFQSVDALHAACPDSAGDWYFTGDYPTPGGERVLARAIENVLAHREGRSY